MKSQVVDRVNFLLGGRPSWVDRPGTQLSAGSEELGRSVEALARPRMGDVWRSVSLKPRHTWVRARYGAEGTEWPSRVCYLGRLNLPHDGSKVRVRRGSGDFGWISRPLSFTNGVAETVGLTRINTYASVSSVSGDPFDAGATMAEAANSALSAMGMILPMRRPPGTLAAGPWMHTLQARFAGGVGRLSPRVRGMASAGGPDVGLHTTQEEGWDEGDGMVVLESRFDAASLTEASGPVWCRVGFDGVDAVGSAGFGGVRMLATTQEKIVRLSPTSVSESGYANLSTTDPNSVKVDDVYDDATVWVGIGPAVPASAMSLVGKFDVPAPLRKGGGKQELAVALRRNSGAGNCSATLYALNGGARTAASVTVDLLPTVGVQWVVLRFDADVFTSHKDAGFELSVQPSGDYAYVVGVAMHAALDEPSCEYDSGWVDLFEKRSGSWWGYDSLDDVGKPAPKGVAHVYFDESGVVTTPKGTDLLVELWYQGGEKFVDDWGVEVGYAEMGRLVDGPAIVGMNLAGGFEIDAVDTSTVDVSEGGVLWEDEGEVYRVVRLRLSELPAERAILDIYEHLIRRAGATGDLLLVVFPESSAFRQAASVWGPPERPPRISHDRGAIFRAELAVKERL